MLTAFERVGKYAAIIGLLGLLILSAAILSDAIMRTLFNAPIYGLSDLMEILIPVIVASCFPTALANRQNITIRFLGRALPARMGQTVELFGQTAALIVFAGLAYEIARYTSGLIQHGQYTWLLKIPIWPSWVLATALIALSLPTLFGHLLETISNIKAGKSLATSEAELLDDIQRES